jgi:hypothetical protein
MTGSDMVNAWNPNSWKDGQKWEFYPQRMRYPSSLETLSYLFYLVTHNLIVLCFKDNEDLRIPSKISLSFEENHLTDNIS